MAEYGAVQAKDEVRFERVLPGPIERVWAYLTEPDKRAQWLAGGSTELRVGGKVELLFRHDDLTPHPDPAPERFSDYGGEVLHVGEILRCEPPRLLEHTWDEGDGNTSQVTFELSERESDVLLVVTHRRLPNRKALVGVCGGWHAHMDLLESRLRGEIPPPFWATYEGYEAQYEKRVPQE